MASRPSEDSYYTKSLLIKITEKQRLMLGIMVDVLGEPRSVIMRRLMMAEAKRCAALMEGEELELWLDLINQIEKEADYHEFVVGEAVSKGMKDSYYQKTGKKLGIDEETSLKTLADKQRVWQRNHRIKLKMKKLKELEEKYE